MLLVCFIGTMVKRVAVILSGCGVYDGTEIHEASAVLVHLSRAEAKVRHNLLHCVCVCSFRYKFWIKSHRDIMAFISRFLPICLTIQKSIVVKIQLSLKTILKRPHKVNLHIKYYMQVFHHRCRCLLQMKIRCML